MSSDTKGKNNISNKKAKDTFALKISVHWDYIDIIREFINSFLIKEFENDRSANLKKCNTISMSISELLENVVKYGKKEGDVGNEALIQLEIFKDKKLLLFFIENKADQQSINELRRQIEEVNLGDPKEMYLNKLKKSLLTDDKSQIGLARIRYEAGGKILLENRKKDFVSIKVVFNMT